MAADPTDPAVLQEQLVQMNQGFAKAQFNPDDMPADFLDDRDELIDRLAGGDRDEILRLEALGVREAGRGEDIAVQAAIDRFLRDHADRTTALGGLDPVVAPTTAFAGSVPRVVVVRTKARTPDKLIKYLRGKFDVGASPQAAALIAALSGRPRGDMKVDLPDDQIDAFKDAVQGLIDKGQLISKKPPKTGIVSGPLPEGAAPGTAAARALFSGLNPVSRQAKELVALVKGTSVIDEEAMERFVGIRNRLMREPGHFDTGRKKVAPAGPAAPAAPGPGVDPGVITLVTSLPSGPMAFADKRKELVFAAIQELFNPSDDVMRALLRIPRGANITLEDSVRIRELLAGASRTGGIDMRAGGATADELAGKLGIARGAPRGKPLSSVLSPGPTTGMASTDSMNAAERSPKLNRQIVEEYNRTTRRLGMIKSGDLDLMDPEKSISSQVAAMISVTGGLDPGLVADVLGPIIEKMYMLSLEGSRGVSRKAAERMTESHSRELENPRWFREALVDPGEMKLDADQQRLFDDAEGDYLGRVSGVWEHSLDPDAARDLMLGRGDPDQLIKAAERAGVDEGDLRTYYGKWAKFEGSLTAAQRKIAGDHMRHHTHMTTQHIQDMIQQEAGLPGVLSAQVRGALQQLERQLEDGTIGHEEALHLMEQIRGAPHDQQRPTSVKQLVSTRPTPLTGQDALFGIIAHAAGEDPRTRLAELKGLAAPTAEEQKGITEIEGIIQGVKDQAVESGPTARGAASKALAELPRVRDEGELMELVRRTLPRITVLTPVFDALTDRGKGMPEKLRLFEGILDAITAKGTVTGDAPRETVPTREAPQLSARQVAKQHLSVLGEPVKIDKKKKIAHHLKGTKEFHPKTKADLKDMMTHMRGKGQLFEVVHELGKLRAVELDQMVPGKTYIWIPSAGGGLGDMARLHIPKPRIGLVGFRKSQAALGGKLRFNFNAHEKVPKGFRVRGKIDLDTLFPEERQSLIEDSAETVAKIQAGKKAVKKQRAQERAKKPSAEEVARFQDRATKARDDKARGVQSFLPSKSAGGGLAPLMERNAWRQNDTEAQFPHIQGLRDKSFRQGGVQQFHAPSHEYAPHGHHMTQKMGGSIWSAIADSSFGRAVEKTSRLAGRTVIHNTIKAEEAFGNAFKRTGTFFRDPSMSNLVETLKGLGDVGLAGFKFTADQAKTIKTWAETTPGLGTSVQFAKKVVPGLSAASQAIDKFGDVDDKELRRIARAAIALKAKETIKKHGPELAKRAGAAVKNVYDSVSADQGGAFAFHGTAGKLMGYPSFQGSSHMGIASRHAGEVIPQYGLIHAALTPF